MQGMRESARDKRLCGGKKSEIQKQRKGRSDTAVRQQLRYNNLTMYTGQSTTGILATYSHN